MVDESILSQRTIHIPATLVGHTELSGVIPGDIYVLDRTSPKYNNADIQEYIDKVRILTHQPVMAAYPLAGHTNQYTVFGIPLKYYKYHQSIGGNSYPIHNNGNHEFAIPYTCIGFNIEGNGFILEPSKTDIIWYHQNRVPFTGYISYSILLYNERYDIYIYMQTQYKSVYDHGTVVKYVPMTEVNQAVLTSAEYNNGTGLPLRWNSSSKDVLFIDETKFNIDRKIPFFELSAATNIKALCVDNNDFNRGDSIENWEIFCPTDMSGTNVAWQRFRSYGAPIDKNREDIRLP